MARRTPLPGLFLVALALAVVVPPDFGAAQTPPSDVGSGRRFPPPQRRGGLFEMLFGPTLVQPFRPQQQQPRQPFFAPLFGEQPTPPPVRPSEPPLATVEILPKDADAKKILVLGDFLAGGLAWGLDQSFADEPKLAVIDHSNTNSGLVRADFFDWNAELLNILNAEKPDIIVISVGANDRQMMRIGKERLAPRSEAWEATYVQRVKGVTETLKVFGRPFFWISAPPMRLAAAGRDMTYLNEFYKPAVAEAGGHFIDIWNGFTNEDGRYISSGPDVDGQLRALRAGDGINFTRAGRLKLAFYVEREIRRETGIGAGAVDLLASTNQTSQIEIGPDGQKRLVGPVISLSDPLPGASNALAGGPDVAVAAVKGETPRYLMVVKGEALPTVNGRADDFTWPPRPRTSVEPVTVSPAAAN